MHVELIETCSIREISSLRIQLKRVAGVDAKLMRSDVLQKKTSSSATAGRPLCRVGQFWPKIEDDVLQTL